MNDRDYSWWPGTAGPTFKQQVNAHRMAEQPMPTPRVEHPVQTVAI